MDAIISKKYDKVLENAGYGFCSWRGKLRLEGYLPKADKWFCLEGIDFGTFPASVRDAAADPEKGKLKLTIPWLMNPDGTKMPGFDEAAEEVKERLLQLADTLDEAAKLGEPEENRMYVVGIRMEVFGGETVTDCRLFRCEADAQAFLDDFDGTYAAAFFPGCPRKDVAREGRQVTVTAGIETIRRATAEIFGFDTSGYVPELLKTAD